MEAMETGALPVLLIGAGALLKDVGITVAGFLLYDWLSDSGMSDEQAGKSVDEGWLGWLNRQMTADFYDSIYSGWENQLDAPSRASLKASVVLAKKAVLDGSLTLFDAYALEKGLEAKAKKLAQAAAIPGVELLPAVEWAGSEMVLTVGDGDVAAVGAVAPRQGNVVLPLLMALGFLGLGAFLFGGGS